MKPLPWDYSRPFRTAFALVVVGFIVFNWYPVQLRLKKDDALMDFWTKYKGGNDKLLEEVKSSSILKNDLEVISVLDKHFDLLHNPGDIADIQSLITAIMAYERHVAIFAGLHAVKDNRTPWDVNPDGGYPKEFELQINQRVEQLEQQRRGLTKAWF